MLALDTERLARLLPENLGSIQTVRAKYKKERRRKQGQLKAKRAAEKKHRMDDSVQEAQMQKRSPKTVEVR